MSKQQNLEANKRLQLFRKEVFITQSAMGDYLGLTQHMVSMIERGNRMLHPNHLTKLVKQKGLNLDWFYNGKGKMLLGKKQRKVDYSLEDLKIEIDVIRQELETMRGLNKKLLKKLNELKK